ncbi:40S ribosomal protein S25 [Lambiella insularis]|nr:40S ribosomal protein S25 [Lambiella insularis]
MQFLGACSDWRQETKEEVVKRKGYARYYQDGHLKEDCKYLINSSYLVKDKANHAVILDKATSDKLYKDVQSYRLITVATLVDRLKINGSLARKALHDLEEKGQIKKVVGHSALSIYSKPSVQILDT